jgi:hypothetical protein
VGDCEEFGGVNRGPAKNLIFLLVTTSQNIWENPRFWRAEGLKFEGLKFEGLKSGGPKFAEPKIRGMGPDINSQGIDQSTTIQ